MKKTFIAVGVASLLGLTSVAQAAEFNWSGTIRAGYTKADAAVGALGANVSSRINLNASTDLGNGLSAGAEISTDLGRDSDGNAHPVGERRNNIWFSGGWGKVTLGKHGGIYRSAANWDQASYLGGNIRTEGDGGGDRGIIYASDLGGPFSFKIELASDDSDAVGRWAATAHYDLGIATVNLGRNTNITTALKNTALSVNGTAGSFGYYVAYESSSANQNVVGIFLSYDVGDNRFYIESENGNNTSDAGNDEQATLLGYRLDLGAGVDFTAEHVNVDSAKNLKLVLRYNF